MRNHFAALLLSVSCISHAADPATHTEIIGVAPSGALRKRLRVVVWNVEKAKERTFSEEFKRIVGDSEIVALQEATTRRSFFGLNELAQLSPPRQFQFVAPLKYGENEFAGTATGAVVRTTMAKPLFTEDKEPRPIGTGKSTVVTKYRISGRDNSLLVANTHGLNASGKLGTSMAPFERQLDAVKQEIASHKGPVLWVGDFNTSNEAKTNALHRVTQPLKLEEIDFGAGATSIKHGLFGRQPLDRGFVRGISVFKATAVKTEGSDHNAFVLELEFR